MSELDPGKEKASFPPCAGERHTNKELRNNEKS